MKSVVFLLIFFLSFRVFAIALPEFPQQQTTSEESELVPLKFDEEKLEEFKNDPAYDFSEAAAEENWWTNFKRYMQLQWQRFMDWMFGDYEMPFLLALLIDILPYLIIGSLIALVLYLFSKLNPASYVQNDHEGEVFYAEDEKIVRNKDIRKLIEKAVAKGQYRLAVRYHFLFVLQQLSKKELIVYDTSKTDEEYLAELKNDDLKRHFQKLNYIYDFIWYGNFDTTAADYEKISREFQKMEGSISS